jgi:hypothetical protein
MFVAWVPAVIDPLEAKGALDVWSVVDGKRSYDSSANGLAFTGGVNGWGGESGGLRQATIDFGTPRTFSNIVLWWHGVEHTPESVTLSYWNTASSSWVSINEFMRNYGATLELGQKGGSSTSDEYLFGSVTASRVRISFNNLGKDISGNQMVHGWLYEFEVYDNTKTVGFIPNSNYVSQGHATDWAVYWEQVKNRDPSINRSYGWKDATPEYIAYLKESGFSIQETLVIHKYR